MSPVDADTLADDSAALAAAAAAAEEALQLEREALALIREGWSSESGSAAADFVDCHCRDGEAVVSALRRCSVALGSMGDSWPDRLPGERVLDSAAALDSAGGGWADPAAVQFPSPEVIGQPPAPVAPLPQPAAFSAPSPAMNWPASMPNFGGAAPNFGGAMPNLGGAIAGLVAQVVDALADGPPAEVEPVGDALSDVNDDARSADDKELLDKPAADMKQTVAQPDSSPEPVVNPVPEPSPAPAAESAEPEPAAIAPSVPSAPEPPPPPPTPVSPAPVSPPAEPPLLAAELPAQSVAPMQPIQPSAPLAEPSQTPCEIAADQLPQVGQ